eukprot:GFUD01014996.1.p1 GENE.GFUD01014996.1~~GFUD01014996.1.p1  ORF type:complete len:836 (-),score=188.93 GFUD01014996.1:75-2582(-)
MVGHHAQIPSGLTVDIVESNVTGHTFASEEEVNLDNLYPALVQCFGIILLGFVAGKFSFISDVEAKGIGTFVGTFSLPALIFVSLCQLDFQSVNWVFLFAITLSKSLIFFLVLFVGLFVHRPMDPARSALYAIFCTQSNDFALGFPVLNAIYGANHPEYPMYLYLLAPVSLAFLNPIGFVLMEIGKSRDSSIAMSRAKIAMKAVQGIIKNPIITMTFLGIIGNLIFHGSMPDIIHNFMQTLGSAFSASALFLLGLRMVGQSSGGGGVKTNLITPFILVTMKSLVLPIIAREVVSQLGAGKDANETLDLSNYAFLYGTIPTAPSVFVYASHYGVLPDMIASTITASTFIAAPLMFVTAKLLTLMNMNPGDYIEQLDIFLLDVSVVGLLAAVWVVFVLLMTSRARQLPHTITLCLAVSQGVACVGAVLWSLLDCRHGWRLYVQFIVFGYGVFASRITTAVLAVTLMLLQTKGICTVLRYRHLLLGISFGVPAILVFALSLNVALETPAHGSKTDPYFQYGTTQAVVALVVIILSLATTVISMILAQRYQSNVLQTISADVTNNQEVSSDETDELLSCDGPIQESSVEIEDLILPRTGARNCGGTGRYRCDSEHRQYCSGLIRRYEVPPAEDALSPNSVLNTNPDTEDHQLLRHNLLLLLLCISMFVGAALCIWTLVMDQFSGIYLELVFFDGFLNLGQSIFTFALFGVNAKGIIIQVCYYTRKLVYGREQIILPPWEDLDQTTRAVSTMFIKHHLAVCMDQVLHDITLNLRVCRGVVTGSELVAWLVERGLVLSRQDGEAFGRHLLRGRVVRHVDDHLDFYDDQYVYTFQPTPGESD